MLLYFFSCKIVKFFCFALADGCWHCHLLSLRKEQVFANKYAWVAEIHLVYKKPLLFVPGLNL